MAITIRADAMRILKGKKEEGKKLLILKAGPGMLWLFKGPLSAMIFQELVDSIILSVRMDCYSLIAQVAIVCDTGNSLVRQMTPP
jgi:hypothetical protein